MQSHVSPSRASAPPPGAAASGLTLEARQTRKGSLSSEGRAQDSSDRRHELIRRSPFADGDPTLLDIWNRWVEESALISQLKELLP